MMAADRARLVAWAGETIAAGSKSFGMASRLLPQRERENAWLLYAWCRTCDDVTDGQDMGYVQQGATPGSIDLWDQTRQALHGDAPVPNAFAALREVQRDAGLPEMYIEDHLRGFDLDRAGWRPQDTGDLTGYCYHVAGAVGCLMAPILGVPRHDEDTTVRACDLGIAFQLNNIARDLVEDARQGRCYIPADWLRDAGLTEDDLALVRHRARLGIFALELNVLARRYEASARVGAARLPWRSRLAILAASNIYGAIGEKVLSRGAGAWDSRTSTSGGEKLTAAGKALLQSARTPADPGRAALFDRTVWLRSGRMAEPQVL